MTADSGKSPTDTLGLLSTLISAVPVGLAFVDMDMRYVVVNEAFAAFSDVRAGQLIGRTLPETSPILWPQIEPMARRAILEGVPTYDFDFTQDLSRLGGDIRHWCVSYVPLRSGGRIVGAGISVLDGKSAGLRSNILGGPTEDIEEIQYTLDIDGHHPASSDRVLDMLGIQRSELADEGDLFLHAATADEDNSLTIEQRLVSADGAVRWVHERAELKVGESGRQTLVGTVQHITEHSETENRLHQMQSELLHVSRLSAMGQVSSTLAHEVNQPLTAIGNYIRAGLLMLESGDPAVRAKSRGVLEKAAQQAARASEIVRNLREFARKGDSARRVENLTIVVQEAMALARLGTKDRGLKVRLRLDGEASLALVNRVEIQQVLVNLIRNAIEAMAESSRRELTVATASGGPDLIQVSVMDSGPGLSETIAKDLFKPFMTTKPEGMGVGLAICHTIVEAHGGKIWAEPNQSGGTVFRFTVQRSSAIAT